MQPGRNSVNSVPCDACEGVLSPLGWLSAPYDDDECSMGDAWLSVEPGALPAVAVGACTGSMPLSFSCRCRLSMYARRFAFSPSRFSAWPRDRAWPVIRSVVRHSVLFWAQGEQPPGWGSQRIFLSCAHSEGQSEAVE